MKEHLVYVAIWVLNQLKQKHETLDTVWIHQIKEHLVPVSIMFHIFVFVFQSLLNKNKDCPKHVFVFIIFSGLISDIAVLPTLCIDPVLQGVP